MNNKNTQIQNTKDAKYADLLQKKQTIWWKHLLDVQAPYRWNIRRLNPGFVLDIGCGNGRNLIHLKGNGIGIDHNEQSVQFSRALGLKTYTPDDFINTNNHQFDSLLLSHVAEHMNRKMVVELLRKYIHLLKAGGKLIMITPQEAGFRSDPTHVEFMDFSKLRSINEQLGLIISQEYSFPFPRFAGNIFTYNEFISVSQKA